MARKWYELLAAGLRLAAKYKGHMSYVPRVIMSLPLKAEDMGMDLRISSRLWTTYLDASFWCRKDGAILRTSAGLHVSAAGAGSSMEHFVGGVGSSMFPTTTPERTIDRIAPKVWRYYCWWVVTAIKHWVSVHDEVAREYPSYMLVDYLWYEHRGLPPQLVVRLETDQDHVYERKVLATFESPLRKGESFRLLQEEWERTCHAAGRAGNGA